MKTVRYKDLKESWMDIEEEIPRLSVCMQNIR